jgi:hypothetical protein
VVPVEAVALTCGIDMQKHGFWFAVRAWARDYRSWLIHYGFLPDWDTIEELLFATAYPVEGKDGITLQIWRAGLDTGGGKGAMETDPTLTEQAYYWLRKIGTGRGCLCYACKGASHPLAGKIHAGKRLDQTPSGKPIPGDWAVDAEGRPTTDPKAALGGTLLPIGGAKGGALALMIEILAAAVTGSAFGWEASSFFDDAGGPPNMGHVLIALDPGRLSAGAYDERMATLLAALAAEPDARLPGTRRLANRTRAAAEGLVIPAALHAEIRALVERPA